jgi:hypothetical protein
VPQQTRPLAAPGTDRCPSTATRPTRRMAGKRRGPGDARARIANPPRGVTRHSRCGRVHRPARAAARTAAYRGLSSWFTTRIVISKTSQVSAKIPGSSAEDLPTPLSCSSAAMNRWPRSYSLRAKKPGSRGTSSGNKPFPPWTTRARSSGWVPARRCLTLPAVTLEGLPCITGIALSPTSATCSPRKTRGSPPGAGPRRMSRPPSSLAALRYRPPSVPGAGGRGMGASFSCWSRSTRMASSSILQAYTGMGPQANTPTASPVVRS